MIVLTETDPIKRKNKIDFFLAGIGLSTVYKLNPSMLQVNLAIDAAMWNIIHDEKIGGVDLDHPLAKQIRNNKLFSILSGWPSIDYVDGSDYCFISLYNPGSSRISSFLTYYAYQDTTIYVITIAFCLFALNRIVTFGSYRLRDIDEFSLIQ